VRLHVKRFPAQSSSAAANEVKAIELLRDAGVPTVSLVGHGRLADGRSFVITEDLAGFRDAEKLVQAGTPFEELLEPTADLAAKLHKAGLHHRDLYLCHFFAKVEGGGVAGVKLIDAARVARMNNFLTRWRWVIKDLSQFWYSTATLPAVTDDQRERWLRRYAERREICWLPRLRAAIKAKSAAIARHDARLKTKQPMRNVSIPGEGSA
jgi:heptose I phosphotransferase